MIKEGTVDLGSLLLVENHVGLTMDLDFSCLTKVLQLHPMVGTSLVVAESACHFLVLPYDDIKAPRP